MGTCFVNVDPPAGAGISSFFHRGKSAEAEAVDRPFGEKRYDPLQATPPPPPLPAQYSQAAQPGPSTALSLHSHTKGTLGEGRRLRSWQDHCNRLTLTR